MAIIVDLDLQLARRNLSVGELAAAVGITPANILARLRAPGSRRPRRSRRAADPDGPSPLPAAGRHWASPPSHIGHGPTGTRSALCEAWPWNPNSPTAARGRPPGDRSAATTVESVAPRMAAAGGGHITGLSSLADRLVSAEAPSCAASKAALSSYLRGLALVLRPQWVRLEEGHQPTWTGLHSKAVEELRQQSTHQLRPAAVPVGLSERRTRRRRRWPDR